MTLQWHQNWHDCCETLSHQNMRHGNFCVREKFGEILLIKLTCCLLKLISAVPQTFCVCASLHVLAWFSMYASWPCLTKFLISFPWNFMWLLFLYDWVSLSRLNLSMWTEVVESVHHFMICNMDDNLIASSMYDLPAFFISPATRYRWLYCDVVCCPH